MAKLQMKSGLERKIKLPLILTLAHSVIKKIGLVEYINKKDALYCGELYST